MERIAPGLPMVPGKVERREFEYHRHGTQTLIAAFDIATGKVEGVVGNTRTEKDFARFLRNLLDNRADDSLRTLGIVRLATDRCLIWITRRHKRERMLASVGLCRMLLTLSG